MHKHKYVIVTGASRGIGLAIAKEYAAHGYSLILVCREHISDMKSSGKKLAAMFDTDCHCVQCDVSSEAEVRKFWEQIKEAGYDIEILINNAGISFLGLLQDMSDTQWQNVLQTNLSSVFYMCRGVIPLFLQKKSGKILNISSVWGIEGASFEAAYSASKAGVNGLTKALGKELAPSNISVNAVALGVIDTEMNTFLSEEERHSLEEEIPAGKIASPEEAAGFIYQLSQANTYFTGQIVSFNGGWY